MPRMALVVVVLNLLLCVILCDKKEFIINPKIRKQSQWQSQLQ